MTSVADIPQGDDAREELSGISPELVLVDPELARLVRGRETTLGSPAATRPERVSALRLVPAFPVEPAIVPRPAPSGPSAPPEAEGSPAVEEPVVAARAVDPPRRAIPAPLAEPARRPAAPRAPAAAPEPVMPHPVTRTSTTPRPARAHPSGNRRRRVVALLGAVVAASLVVLALLRLTDGPSDPAPTAAGLRAPGSTPEARRPAATPKPPAARSRSRAKAGGTARAKPRATPKVRTSPKTTPARPSARAAAAATPKAVPKPVPKPAAAAPAAGSATSTAASNPSPVARRFAWAPVEGATGYHVELFKGPQRVLARETKEPVLELGRSWRYAGRTMTLTPGEYRWYVWAVTRSGRATEAVVQAKLTI